MERGGEDIYICMYREREIYIKKELTFILIINSININLF
jgi:hypothetical protein